MWTDILMIAFSATTANHLGLVAAVEGVVGRRLPIVNCPKCLAFWSALACGIVEAHSSLFTLHSSFTAVAAALLAAYLAIWIELLEGMIDTLYTKLYDTLYATTDPADTDALGAADAVPGVRKPSARRRHTKAKRKNH